jgi:sugar phosphate isomerase/epimerase
MAAPIALQLYSVREQAKDDFAGVVKQVADMGYAGVEPAGFPGTTPQAAAQLFRDLGLQVCSAHLPLPVGDKAAEVIDTAGILGCTRVVSGLGPDNFKDADAIRRAAATFNEAGANAGKAGLAFGIHNHWWEFLEVDGRRAYEILLEELDPAVFLQIDTYWVKVGGADPAAVVASLGTRAPLLHIKDGPGNREEPMTAVGDGIMDFPAIVEAAGDDVDWLIVELDRCGTDMVEAVAKSCRYLIDAGLGQGR